MTETIKPVKTWKEGVGRIKMIINGEWAEAASGRWLSVENPAHRGTDAGQVPQGGAPEVDRAVEAAAGALAACPALRNGLAGVPAEVLDAGLRLFAVGADGRIDTDSRSIRDRLLRRG